MPILGPTTNHEEIRLWADAHKALPMEALPGIVDHEPAMLCLLLPDAVRVSQNVRVITWEDFFSSFDELGLTFVYHDDSTQSELLQMEERSPYRNHRYRPIRLAN